MRLPPGMQPWLYPTGNRLEILHSESQTEEPCRVHQPPGPTTPRSTLKQELLRRPVSWLRSGCLRQPCRRQGICVDPCGYASDQRQASTRNTMQSNVLAFIYSRAIRRLTAISLAEDYPETCNYHVVQLN